VICSVSPGAILTHCVRKVQLRLIHAQVSGADSKAKHEVVPVGAEKDNSLASSSRAGVRRRRFLEGLLDICREL